MSGILAAVGPCFLLGIMTAISPCLFATNVAAITFIARRIDRPRLLLLAGAGYTLGQAAAFLLLSGAVIWSLVTIEPVSYWLQRYMFRVLGPILIVAGLFLIELIWADFGTGRLRAFAQRQGKRGGFATAVLLGFLFAIAFCPTSAALFFGGLIPLALSHESSVALPLAYAAGVSAPVLGIVLVAGLAANVLQRFAGRVRGVDRWMRRIAGAVFIGLGVYFTLRYSLGWW